MAARLRWRALTPPADASVTVRRQPIGTGAMDTGAAVSAQQPAKGDGDRKGFQNKRARNEESATPGERTPLCEVCDKNAGTSYYSDRLVCTQCADWLLTRTLCDECGRVAGPAYRHCLFCEAWWAQGRYQYPRCDDEDAPYVSSGRRTQGQAEKEYMDWIMNSPCEICCEDIGECAVGSRWLCKTCEKAHRTATCDGCGDACWRAYRYCRTCEQWWTRPRGE